MFTFDFNFIIDSLYSNQYTSPLDPSVTISPWVPNLLHNLMQANYPIWQNKMFQRAMAHQMPEHWSIYRLFQKSGLKFSKSFFSFFIIHFRTKMVCVSNFVKIGWYLVPLAFNGLSYDPAFFSLDLQLNSPNDKTKTIIW